MSFTLLLLAAMQAAPVSPLPEPPAAEEKKICRSDAETGSRLAKKRRCMTAKEWAAEAQANRDEFEAQRRQNRTQF